MTADKDQAQQVIADRIINRRFELASDLVQPSVDLPPKLLVLALEHLVPAKQIYGTVLGGGHQPGARLIRNTGLRPLLERGDQNVLPEVLGNSNVPHYSGQTRD